MSDTHQVVHWALGFACPLRSAGTLDNPERASAAIWQARRVADDSRHASGFGIFGDVCVTSCQMQHVPKELGRSITEEPSPGPNSTLSFLHRSASRDDQAIVHIPANGFLISQEFGNVGGVAGFISMCGGCPANASAPGPAGCAGTLFQSPDCPDVESQLRYTIKRLGLEQDWADVFLPTNPLWYGLWARSPLSDRASELIGAILDEMMRQDIATQSTNRESLSEFRALVRAAKIARERHIPLHVSMDPPGHVDFDCYTVFPHCPRCKAEGNLKRWQRRYPKEIYTCQVCGWGYSPAATESGTTCDFESEPTLRKALGTEAYGKFTLSYLIDQGYTPEKAQKIMKLVDDSEAEQAREASKTAARDEQRGNYIQNVVYVGLRTTRPQNFEEHGDMPFFRADEFLQLLCRCHTLGVNVVLMYHESTNDDLCLSSSFPLKDQPETVFPRLRAQGCDEWFGALIGVPDKVLDGPSGSAGN